MFRSWDVVGELQMYPADVPCSESWATAFKLNHQVAVWNLTGPAKWCGRGELLADELEERLNKEYPLHQPSSKVIEKEDEGVRHVVTKKSCFLGLKLRMWLIIESCDISNIEPRM